MKILIACEESGIVRDEFTKRGHDAISCDLLSTSRTGPHIQKDIRCIDVWKYDMMIAFPPCTLLCCSGARWWKANPNGHKAAKEFFMWFVKAKVQKRQLKILLVA